MQKPSIPKGTRDFGPAQVARRQHIFNVIRRTFESFGYAPLETPTLENLSRFIWERVAHAGKLARVSVHRDSCNESCTYYGPQD